MRRRSTGRPHVTDDNWLNSLAGQRARHWNRDLVRVFAHAKIEPRSKKSITPDEKTAFVDALAQGLGSRRGFRAPVMVELDLFSGADNPPEIHTVAKNYLDLTYPGPLGGGRLLDDDRQIHYLAVRYFPRVVAEPGIYLRATRMSCLREDARLVQRIRQDEDRRWHENDDSDSERAVDELRNWERIRDYVAETYGQQTYEHHRRFFLARFQRACLAATERVLHSILLDILSGDRPEPTKEIELGGVRFPAIDLVAVNRSLLFSRGISLQLAPLPRTHGESASFRMAVRDALSELRDSMPRMFPLLSELAVVLLLVPPESTTGDLGIDLDNLARKIIPQVHEILEPPARTPIPDPNTISDPRLRAFFEQEAKIARRLPKHHVTRYEVIAVPRAMADPPSGYVRLALCDGALGGTFAELVRDRINNWKESAR